MRLQTRVLCGGLLAAGLASGAQGGLVDVYTDQAAFEAAAADANKLLKFIETFEEGNLGFGEIATLNSPLEPGVPNVDGNGLGFPTGLDATNMFIAAGTPGNFLVGLGDGFIGNNTTVVGANTFADSTIIGLLDSDKTGIGFNVQDPIGGTGDYDVTVTATNGDILFSGIVSAGATDGSFMGFLSTSSILSIEVAGALDGGELLDNIQMWAVPAPGALALFGLAGLAAGRRRRA